MGTLVHAFNHSYVNRLLEAHSDRFAQSAPRVFAAVVDAMRDQSYGEWRMVLAESRVRAAVARYELAHRGAKAAREEVVGQQAKGYVYLPELFDLLAEYEAGRKKYPTFAAFMPRVIAYFDSLAGRIDEVKHRYDARCPLVASLSVENGSEAVDPVLAEIVVRFNRPM